MTELTIKQERALSKMSPDAAARRRATMIAEREIVTISRHDNAVIANGDNAMILSPFRATLRAGLGK